VSSRFELQSVVHLVRPAGRLAHHLEELRVGIGASSPQTLFYHSLQHVLRHPAVEELHPADFTAWINGVVQDRETAERVAFAIEQSANTPDQLRDSLLEVLDSIPEKTRVLRDAPEDGEFTFLDMESVLVPTGRVCEDASDVIAHFGEANPSVLFYHLIEQPWLAPAQPSLLQWLRDQGDERLARLLELVAGSGQPLETIRRRILRRWKQSTLGRRLAAAVHTPEDEKREEGRRAVANLVRRITQPETPSDSRRGS
jgi:uncharacterized protein DUF5752